MNRLVKKLNVFFLVAPLGVISVVSCSQPSEQEEKKLIGKIENKEYKIYLNGKPTSTNIKVGQTIHKETIKDWGFDTNKFSSYNFFRIEAIHKNKGQIVVLPLNNDLEVDKDSVPWTLQNFKILLRDFTEYSFAWNKNTNTLDLSKLETLEELIELLINKKDENFAITKLKSQKKIVDLILDQDNQQKDFINYLNEITNIEIKIVDKESEQDKQKTLSTISFDLENEKAALIESIQNISPSKTQSQKDKDYSKNMKIVSDPLEGLLTFDIIKELMQHEKFSERDFLKLTSIDHNEFKSFRDFVKKIEQFLDQIEKNEAFKSWIQKNYLDLKNFKGNFLFEVISGG